MKRVLEIHNNVNVLNTHERHTLKNGWVGQFYVVYLPQLKKKAQEPKVIF